MIKNLKRIIFFILTTAMFLFLCGCSDAGDTTTQEKEKDGEGVIDITKPTEEFDAPSQTVAAEEEKKEESYKYVAFTFDDGPHNEITKKIVDTLNSYDGHATFFVVGDRINDKSAETIKYAADNGNEIGMHSFTHKYYFDKCDDIMYEQEIKYTYNRLSSYAGVKSTLLRPPGGLMSAERISASPYAVILWSVDSLDWRYKTAENEEMKATNIQTIVDNVLSTVSDGDIILMHDIYENTYLAFRIIAEALYNDGYRFITVSELLGDSIRSGAKFHSAVLN